MPIKLSDTQKQIIRLMREGKELYAIFYINGTPNIINGKRIQASTFTKLSNLELIVFDKETLSKTGLRRTFYKLTEFGKTIEL